eukprot:2242801-Alexandrium_andersonii.AAC.1
MCVALQPDTQREHFAHVHVTAPPDLATFEDFNANDPLDGAEGAASPDAEERGLPTNKTLGPSRS